MKSKFLYHTGTDNMFRRLEPIKGDKPENISENYIYFAGTYFADINKSACMDNQITEKAQFYMMSAKDAHYSAMYAGMKDELYYFHANHLGSGSMITDENGETYQTMHYAPYGELLINKYAGSYNEPHKFTGYERDNESGLDYAHARSRDINLGFISTDPMWFRYPGLSSYAYCKNNPIRYTDPTGAYILDFKSLMHIKAGNQGIFNLNFGTNNDYQRFYYPYPAAGGNFITEVRIPDIVTYNSSPVTSLSENSSNIDRSGNAVGAALEFLATGTAGVLNSVNKNEYIDIVNSREAFTMAFNAVMNNEMISQAFANMTWSDEITGLIDKGEFGISNFQADIMNYITDGNLSMVNFPGYDKKEFYRYRTAVYQMGESILQNPDVNLKIPSQNTFWNNIWDTYIYMGR